MHDALARALWSVGVPLTGSAAQNALLVYLGIAVCIGIVLLIVLRK